MRISGQESQGMRRTRPGQGRAALGVVLALCAVLAGCGGDGGNRAPVAANSTANGWEDTILQGPLQRAIDADGDAVTYELVGAPSHGAALVQANGTFSYTPAPNFNGSDEFTWRVSDPRGAGNTYNMVLTVTPVNDAPRLQGAPSTPPGGITGNGVILQPDGRFVVVGNSSSDIALLRYNADGLLDTGFGAGGIVTTPVGNHARGHGLALQPDGKLVVTGHVSGGGSQDIALLRYNADGSLDTGFGGGDGIVTVPVGYVGGYYSMVLQPDGKLVVTGQVYDANGRIALLRYNADGSLDTSFGGGGIVTSPVGYYISGYSLALRPDGKFLVTGSDNSSGIGGGLALLRYNADGSLDTSFGGGDGIVSTRLSSYSYHDSGLSVILQPDGRLVAMGEACYEGMPAGDCLIVLLRYNADGLLDTSFGGGDGILFNDSGYISYRGNSVALQPDGKLVVTRETDAYSSSSEIALQRYNTDGSLDTGFGGGDGFVTTTMAVGGVFCCGNRAALQPDGRLVVAGSNRNSNSSEIALLRYNADGSFDPTFGKDVVELREGAAFSVPLPTNRIVDPDSDSLTYTAKLANSALLPAWLSLNSATGTFSGTVPGGTAGQNLVIRITATDPGGLSVSNTFNFALVP
jgi:uncharacterized delta-60 repeat protein